MKTKSYNAKRIIAESNEMQRIINTYLTDEEAAKLEAEAAARRQQAKNNPKSVSD